MLTNKMVIDLAYRANGKKCKLTYAKKTIPFFAPMAWAYKKNGPYTPAFAAM